MVYALNRNGDVDFAPLQGELAKEMGLTKFADKAGGSMVMLRETDGEKFFKGDAWIELGKILGGFWALLAGIFGFFPKGFRDWIYDFVAERRYLIAGKNNACAMPEDGLRARMRS